jgi:hypothetical protein
MIPDTLFFFTIPHGEQIRATTYPTALFSAVWKLASGDIEMRGKVKAPAGSFNNCRELCQHDDSSRCNAEYSCA